MQTYEETKRKTAYLKDKQDEKVPQELHFVEVF